ncbi:MAG: hypothetical protein Ta2G_04940 [Termitinemataceae bacterium]|nr:MAG: hypothetical protein Ta2G_04940 [Termitinemataceae bacterium]
MEIVISDSYNENDGHLSRTPNCLKCVNFKVSWDVNFPRVCKLFGIKCRSLPSAEVFKATKQHCPSFKMNPEIKT